MVCSQLQVTRGVRWSLAHPEIKSLCIVSAEKPTTSWSATSPSYSLQMAITDFLAVSDITSAINACKGGNGHGVCVFVVLRFRCLEVLRLSWMMDVLIDERLICFLSVLEC